MPSFVPVRKLRPNHQFDRQNAAFNSAAKLTHAQ
jgi:hypothetical protein